jgi:hypothetical protein
MKFKDVLPHCYSIMFVERCDDMLDESEPLPYTFCIQNRVHEEGCAAASIMLYPADIKRLIDFLEGFIEDGDK